MYNRRSYVSRSIFDRLDIIYHRLSYVSIGALPFKLLILYIYRPRTVIKSIIQPILFFLQFHPSKHGLSIL
jgi:hypothetical protein